MQYDKIILLTPADLLVSSRRKPIADIMFDDFLVEKCSWDIYTHAETVLFLDLDKYKFLKNKYKAKYADVTEQKAEPVPDKSRWSRFNLERALAGDPVVTRDGKTVKIAGYNSKADKECQLSGWIGAYAYVWKVNGVPPFEQPETHPNDLFMASKQREVWVNLYVTSKTGSEAGDFVDFKTESDADEDHRRHWRDKPYELGIIPFANRLGGKAHKIIIEE